MILVLRALARVITFLLLLGLALTGLAAAVFSLQGGDAGLSLPALASHLQLDELRDNVGGFLDDLEADGSVAVASALAGAAAMTVGLLLLLGALVPRRERLVVLDRGADGTIAARRRPLAQLATALARRSRGVTRLRARVRPNRWRAGGRLRMKATHSVAVTAREVKDEVREALQPLSDPFGLRLRVRTTVGDARKRGN